MAVCFALASDCFWKHRDSTARVHWTALVVQEQRTNRQKRTLEDWRNYAKVHVVLFSSSGCLHDDLQSLSVYHTRVQTWARKQNLAVRETLASRLDNEPMGFPETWKDW